MRARRLAWILGAAIVLAGCQAQIDAAGEPGDTQVLVSRSSIGLAVTAPLWRPPQTLVYLCPVAPTKTVAGLVDAGSISLSPDCVTYGLIDTNNGLDDPRLSGPSTPSDGRRSRPPPTGTWSSSGFVTGRPTGSSGPRSAPSRSTRRSRPARTSPCRRHRPRRARARARQPAPVRPRRPGSPASAPDAAYTRRHGPRTPDVLTTG